MSTDAWTRLWGTATMLAAAGTDPRTLATLLAWSVGPRRSLEALRRAVVADGGARGGASPGAELAARAATGLGPADATAADTVARRWTQLGCRIAVVGDPSYPARLSEGWPESGAPVLLAARGAPPTNSPAVAVVGSRRASPYGTAVAAWLAESVARSGVRIVSGGALGVDAAAHRAALLETGGTTVVLGCGHGIAYPRAHGRAGGLFEQILAHGGRVVSEQLPDVPPRAGVVRARNRIVAGLADAVVVVEGGPRSGALLTAGAAAGLGRPVLAVPGDVRAAGSRAPHLLLREGAEPCTGPADVLAALGTAGDPGRPPDAGPSHGDPESVLEDAVGDVLVGAWPRPLPVDEVAERAGVPVGRLLASLTRAQIVGEVALGPEGVRLRRSPGSAVPARRGARRHSP